MGRLTVRLPDALHRQLEMLARSEGVSLNHYLVYALTRQATLDAHRLETKGNGRMGSMKSEANKEQAESSPDETRGLMGGPTGTPVVGEQGAAGDLNNLPDDEIPPPGE